MDFFFFFGGGGRNEKGIPLKEKMSKKFLIKLLYGELKIKLFILIIGMHLKII